MQKRNTIIIASIIGAAALAIFWRITKRKKEKKQSQPIKPPIEIPVGSGSTGTTGGATTNTNVITNNYQTLTVATQKDPLVVRNSPSGTKIDSLVKGTKIFARPSSVNGWHEYSKDGITTFGYVSSQFLKA